MGDEFCHLIPINSIYYLVRIDNVCRKKEEDVHHGKKKKKEGVGGYF